MFQHNRQRELDIEGIHENLEIILQRAKEHNELCLDHIEKGMGAHDKVAMRHADIRDAYLNAYYLITGINVDYADL